MIRHQRGERQSLRHQLQTTFDGIEQAGVPKSSSNAGSGTRAKAEQSLHGVVGGQVSGREIVRYYDAIEGRDLLELILLKLFQSNMYMQSKQESNRYNRHRQPRQNWLRI